jgi:hypothetical protein
LEGKGGLKLGVGFTVLPLVSVNLEYLASSFNKAGASTLSPEWKTSGYGLSVSLPLSL